MSRSFARRQRSVSLPRRRRWTAEDARAALARLDASGLTVRQFAEREGLDRQRLYWWRAQIGGTTPAFVEIERPAAGPVIEVVLRSGQVLRVADGFSEATLRRLMAILADAGSRC